MFPGPATSSKKNTAQAFNNGSNFPHFLISKSQFFIVTMNIFQVILKKYNAKRAADSCMRNEQIKNTSR